MRVLFVADSLDMGGAERQVLGTAAALRGRGHDVVVVVSAGGPLADVARRAGVPVTVGCRTRAKREVSLDFAVAVRREVERRRPDVVHAHMFASAVAAMLALRGSPVPLIVTEHSEGTWRGDTEVGISRICHLSAARVITVSDALRRQLEREGVPPRRIVTVPNTLLPLPAAPAPAPGPQPIPRSAGPLVGVVARMRPEKGLDAFLHAAAAVAARRPDVSFVVAGDGPQADHLRTLAARLGLAERVCFPGLCHDGATLLASLDVAVLPSLANEGTPLVILEAMRAGTPIVATRTGGIPEQVRHGREALLVPPGDPPALADALLGLLDRPELARRLALAARSRFERHFSPERMIGATEAVYESTRPTADAVRPANRPVGADTTGVA